MLFLAFHGFMLRFFANSQGNLKKKIKKKKKAEISTAFQTTPEASCRSRVAGHAVNIKGKKEEEM
jgi:hypothetical protein